MGKLFCATSILQKSEFHMQSM